MQNIVENSFYESNHSAKNRVTFDPNKGIAAQQVFNAFFKQPVSRKEVDYTTGVEINNICYYVDQWKERGTIAVFKKVIQKNGKQIELLTTNPDLFPIPDTFQLNLFDHE